MRHTSGEAAKHCAFLRQFADDSSTGKDADDSVAQPGVNPRDAMYGIGLIVIAQLAQAIKHVVTLQNIFGPFKHFWAQTLFSQQFWRSQSFWECATTFGRQMLRRAQAFKCRRVKTSPRQSVSTGGRVDTNVDAGYSICLGGEDDEGLEVPSNALARHQSRRRRGPAKSTSTATTT